MSTETELRQWLQRPDKDLLTNLQFGIKAWHSIEFGLITKYEIITEEFCTILPKIRKHLKVSSPEYAAAWQQTINEFLALKCAPGAISTTIKDNLITIIINEMHRSKQKPQQAILDGLLHVLHSSQMQNFFKSYGQKYGEFIGNIIIYLNVLIKKHETDNNSNGKNVMIETYQNAITRLLNEMKVFIKSTPHLDAFRSGFLKNAIIPFSEMVVLLGMMDENSPISNWREILNEIYFTNIVQKRLKKYLIDSTVRCDLYMKVFNVPCHAFLLFADTFIQAHRHDDELLPLFIRHLFEQYYQESNQVFSQRADLLDSMTIVFGLLKRYDIQLTFNIDGIKSLTYVAQQLNRIFDRFITTDARPLIGLICATLRLNPMILEQSIFSIVTRSMLTAKDSNTMPIFEELLSLVIDCFKRLGRSEKFVSQLMKCISETLSTMRLSKKLKRKSQPSDEIPTKYPAHNLSAADAKNGQSDNEEYRFYLNKILSASSKPPNTVEFINSTLEPWPMISFAWPVSVASTFTKFITGLMSKPSLVIWKTLIYTLTDSLKPLKDGASDENTLFIIEFSSALLTQYFIGSRLAEQSDQMWNVISENCELTHRVLNEFGTAILNQEHNTRTMNSFLRICYAAGNFELLRWYYRPDSISDLPDSVQYRTIETVHSYLTPQEWVLIEQRISNFGKNECCNNINRLFIQKHKLSHLLTNKSAGIHLLSTSLTDIQHISMILRDETLANWFISRLTRTELQNVTELILMSDERNELVKYSVNDRNWNEMFILNIFSRFHNFFRTRKSILNNIEFSKILNFDQDYLPEVITLIQTHISTQNDVKKYSSDEIREHLDLLNVFATKFHSADVKNIAFILAVGLYFDLKMTDDLELRTKCGELIKVLLHFGEAPNFGKYFLCTDLQSVFGESEITIFDAIFAIVVHRFNTDDRNLVENFLQHFEESKQIKGIMNIFISLMDNLAKEKKCKEYFQRSRRILMEKINLYFARVNRTTEEDKDFIHLSLNGFTTVLAAISSSSSSAAAASSDEPASSNTIEMEFQIICQKYLNYSIAPNNAASFKLLNLAIINRNQLNISEKQIKELIDEYWQLYFTAIKMKQPINQECLESLLKLIFTNRSAEELVELFTELHIYEMDSAQGESFMYYKLFETISKLLLNKAKGSIFIEAFKQFSLWTTMSLRKLDADAVDQIKFIELLECQKLICNNTHLPVTIEFIDDILSFLCEINIKKFTIRDKNTNDSFLLLHSHVSDVCTALAQHRYQFISDRIPQFVVIIRDLLQSICWYKCDRNRNEQLENHEIQAIADLIHKVENIIKLLVNYGKNVKRVAPYLLIFIMHLITSNERPTTLYPKIKTYIESICYDLISVCDHRIEGFILRNCNEAMKPIYEQFVKDYDRYHKFKGKV